MLTVPLPYWYKGAAVMNRQLIPTSNTREMVSVALDISGLVMLPSLPIFKSSTFMETALLIAGLSL